MKQILLFFLCFYLFSMTIAAQNTDFAPVGAYWKYNWRGVILGGEALLKITGDTIINGRTLRKVDMEEYQYPPPTYQNGIRRTYRYAYVDIRNDSIFTVSGQNSSKLLYTTKMQLGDTVKFFTTSNYLRYALVESFGTIDIDGVVSRVVYFSQYCFNQTNRQLRFYGTYRIIENFGLLGQVFFRPEPDCGFIDDNRYSLICYQSGNLRYPSNQICSPTVATNEPNYANQISIAPNPASNELSINSPSEMKLNLVELINYLGQKVSAHSSESNQKINVSNVPNGVYFLHLQFDNQSITKKIVVQH